MVPGLAKQHQCQEQRNGLGAIRQFKEMMFDLRCISHARTIGTWLLQSAYSPPRRASIIRQPAIFSVEPTLNHSGSSSSLPEEANACNEFQCE